MTKLRPLFRRAAADAPVFLALRQCGIVVLAVWSLTCMPFVSAQDGPPLLPGGASSLTETYDDWTVRCEIVDMEGQFQRACALSQRQVNRQGQQVLAIELTPTGEGLSGLMVLPFGLAVSERVTLSIDDAPSLADARFSTCGPSGCLVPITLSSESASRMRVGGVLLATAPVPGGGNVEMAVSLIGISTAITRVIDLTK